VVWDRGGGPEDAVVIAGSGRSGTTWVEEIVNAGRWARVMFEPLRVSEVPELRPLGAYTYLRPGDTRYLELVERLLSGHPRHNRWVNHQNYTRVATRRIVKEIRAHGMLAWLSAAFPRTPVLFAVRHPVTVVSSQQRMGWRAQLQRFTSQPELVNDHLSSIIGVIEEIETDAQALAAHWCIENLVAFRTMGGTAATLVPYESLVADPTAWTSRILDAAGRGTAVVGAGTRPSKMAHADSVVRHGGDAVTDSFARVDASTRRQVLDVVAACGLGDLYGDDPRPDVEAIDRLWRSGGGSVASGPSAL
jgi:hypothetical protein